MSENSIQQKNASRLVFVQALYGTHFGIPVHSAEDWVSHYSEDRLSDMAVPELEEDDHTEELFELRHPTDPDFRFLRKLLRGWLEEKAAIEKQLTELLSGDEKRSFDRLSPLIQSILVAGSYELIHIGTKPPVVLKEYVAIAAGFFDNPELGFINGTLQEIARSLS
jgi:transcription termination factor NusB